MMPRNDRQIEHPRRRELVCLLGASLDGGNLGVSALAAALVRLVRRARPGARVRFFYGDSRGGRRLVPTADGVQRVCLANFRLSPRARPGEHLLVLLALALLCRLVPALRPRLVRANARLRTLAEADFIGDIHAGDSFSDIYGLRRFLVEVLPNLIVLLLGRPLVLLPQTYGPFHSRTARALSRWILRSARAVYARDAGSAAVARGLIGQGLGRPEVRFCPDVAFALDPVKGGFGTVQPPVIRDETPLLIGLNISGLLAIGGYTGANMFGLACDYGALTAALIDRLMAETDAHVLIVPHVIDEVPESDARAALRVWREAFTRHGRRVHLLTGHYGPSHVKYLIGQCDFFIGGRMHACIAALSQGVPALGIAYSVKFQGVFESVGVGELALDARRLAQDEIMARCLAALAARDGYRERLADGNRRIRERLARCFATEMERADAAFHAGRNQLAVAG